MKKLFWFCTMIVILFVLVSFTNGYIRIFAPINLNNVSQLHVESDIKEKYKSVTNTKDISLILKFVNSVRFKDTNKIDYRSEVIRNYKGKLKEFKINYRITIIKKNNPPDWIVINILNDNEVYYSGRLYLVNTKVQKKVAEIYKNLKYMEYETIPRIHIVKVPKKNN